MWKNTPKSTLFFHTFSFPLLLNFFPYFFYQTHRKYKIFGIIKINNFIIHKIINNHNIKKIFFTTSLAAFIIIFSIDLYFCKLQYLLAYRNNMTKPCNVVTCILFSPLLVSALCSVKCFWLRTVLLFPFPGESVVTNLIFR